MAVKFVDKFKVGWQAVIEAEEGHLLGGRMVDTGPVFDTLYRALTYMNVVIEENEKAYRIVRLGKVLLFEGDCVDVSRMIHLDTSEGLWPSVYFVLTVRSISH